MSAETVPLLLAETAAVAEPQLGVVKHLGVWSLLPPLLAIGMAVVFRRVALALLIGVVTGSLLVARGDVTEATVALFRDYLVGDSDNFREHAVILLFTTLLGTTIGVITRLSLIHISEPTRPY